MRYFYYYSTKKIEKFKYLQVYYFQKFLPKLLKRINYLIFLINIWPSLQFSYVLKRIKMFSQKFLY